MKANDSVLAKRYAKAYDGLAQGNALAKVNMTLFKDVLSALKPVENHLNNPTIPSCVKLEIVSKICSDNNQAGNFVKTLISAGRYYLAPEIEKELQNLLDVRFGIKRVSVTCAAEMEESAKIRLRNYLSEYFNSIVELDFKTDASLLSGITVRCGDILIDGSASGRLKQMAKILTER